MGSIKKVAEIAGVSPSTVSRVMNGTANVDEKKRQRVLDAIEEIGFRPNELARALLKKTSKIIGVIIPNIENPFFSELAKSIEEEAYCNGYKILLCNSNNNTDKEMMNIQMLNQINADGIIIMTNSELVTNNVISNFNIPIVMVDRKLLGLGEIANIQSDNYKGGKIATEHLLNCGCKNIVCIRNEMEYDSGKQRYKGYRDICRKYNIKEQYVDCKYDYEEGLKAARELIEKYPDVDGIVACNDMVAISTYKVLMEAGYRVPGMVQIIGFDNIKLSSIFTPEITTICQPIKDMGTLAVQIIMKNIRGEEFDKENIFDVRLIERQTTKRKGANKMKFAVVGSINMDMTVTARRIPSRGETIQGDTLSYIPGGKGANQAVAMAKLGEDVTMFGCVGSDSNGQKMIENLKNLGVNTNYIKVLEGVPTGIAMITVGENDNTIVVVPGANGKVDKRYIDSIKDVLENYDMVVLQHEIPLETVHYVIEFCAEKNIPVVLNPAPASPVPMDIIEKVTYLTPNEHEAGIIFGDNQTTEELLKRYPEKLVITQGSRGVSTALKSGEILKIPPRLAHVVDTTGAGDTLNGAFSVEICRGLDIKNALLFANTAASLSIEKFGAQAGMPTREEVNKELGR